MEQDTREDEREDETRDETTFGRCMQIRSAVRYHGCLRMSTIETIGDVRNAGTR